MHLSLDQHQKGLLCSAQDLGGLKNRIICTTYLHLGYIILTYVFRRCSLQLEARSMLVVNICAWTLQAHRFVFNLKMRAAFVSIFQPQTAHNHPHGQLWLRLKALKQSYLQNDFESHKDWTCQWQSTAWQPPHLSFYHWRDPRNTLYHQFKLLLLDLNWMWSISLVLIEQAVMAKQHNVLWQLNLPQAAAPKDI